jgi:hypothetical protein
MRLTATTILATGTFLALAASAPAQTLDTTVRAGSAVIGSAITREIAGQVSDQMANNARRATKETREAASLAADEPHPDRTTR